MGRPLAELARAALVADEHAPPLERLWLRAAMQAVASARVVDPPHGEARRLSQPEVAWTDVAPWPAEALQDRIGRLIDSHRLAIALDDGAWLRELLQSWKAAPSTIDELWRLRAEGEIGLALAPDGPRPDGWSAAELDLLTGESFLTPGAPADDAWRALAERDVEGTQRHLAALDALMEEVARGWEAAPEAGLRQIRTYPGSVLRLEARALRALTQRLV